MQIQISNNAGHLNQETLARRTSKVKAYAASKGIEVISGPFWGVVPDPSSDRERLIETAVNRLASGEKLYQEEIDA